jgi:hypothetical protein
VALTLEGPATLTSLDDTARVRARVLDAAGRELDGSALRWSVRPGGAIAPDGAGIYRAVGNGRATVVAEIDVGETGVRPDGYWASRVADSVVVDVRQRAARLALAPADTGFWTLGAVRRLAVRVTDARGHALLDGPPPLTWRSADAAVVAVDADGVVRSVAEGVSRVTVQAGDLAGATTFTVSPRRPHTSCAAFTQRRQARQTCVTLDFVMREREGAP